MIVEAIILVLPSGTSPIVYFNNVPAAVLKLDGSTIVITKIWFEDEIYVYVYIYMYIYIYIYIYIY